MSSTHLSQASSELTNAANVVEALAATIKGNQTTRNNLKSSAQNLADICAGNVARLRNRFDDVALSSEPSDDRSIRDRINAGLDALSNVADELRIIVPDDLSDGQLKIQIEGNIRNLAHRVQPIADELRDLSRDLVLE
jgi:hypothetical protein